MPSREHILPHQGLWYKAVSVQISLVLPHHPAQSAAMPGIGRVFQDASLLPLTQPHDCLSQNLRKASTGSGQYQACYYSILSCKEGFAIPVYHKMNSLRGSVYRKVVIAAWSVAYPLASALLIWYATGYIE